MLIPLALPKITYAAPFLALAWGEPIMISSYPSALKSPAASTEYPL